ncbi:MAG: NAD(P)-dependent oxidoreductase [Hydrogenophilaceae bacterium]|jgi:glutamate synthase (NADPH/NADH) small chain|nr:NAD(P)-dependent oxidoreductase [Hydrogenophilaceae bacterium]
MADTKMLKFAVTARRSPEKRAPKTRRRDFDEIFGEYARLKAEEQAGRCSQCGVPFCQVHCPLHNNIPDWLMLTAEGRLEEAYELSASTNSMPEICGRICPQDRLCERLCVTEQSGHGAITIGAIEKYITETAWENGWVRPIRPRRDLGLSIGVVGAGPAGMAAAEALRGHGYRVVIYDRHDRAGGLLTYGIPNFKLDKQVVQRRVDRLADGGVEIRLNCAIGADETLAALRTKHAAVLVATGAYAARDLEAPGRGLAGIVPALSFLIAANRAGLGDVVPEHADGSLLATDRNVVVIGGGDTAMDCVRTAVRQGAKSVTCLYRRDRANMPGSLREVGYAEEEGVKFSWLAAPRAFLGDERVRGVRAAQMRLGAPDANGRRAVEAIPGGDFNLDADLVILALGFDPEPAAALGVEGLRVDACGNLETDPRTLMTSLPGVYAAGDVARGASLVVWAIRDGRMAAAAMHRSLMREHAAPALAD